MNIYFYRYRCSIRPSIVANLLEVSMAKRYVLTSAQVLEIITSPKCGIHGQTWISRPLKDVFASLSASFWISMVSNKFSEIPEEVLEIKPEDTIAGVADRIAEYLSKETR